MKREIKLLCPHNTVTDTRHTTVSHTEIRTLATLERVPHNYVEESISVATRFTPCIKEACPYWDSLKTRCNRCM